MKKAVNVKAKAGLQPHSMIKELDSKCPKRRRPSVKKDKNDTYWEHRNKASKDKKKAKSHPLSSANQPQTQVLKKDKRHKSWRGHLATGVNAIEVAKKNKDKIKDLSHIKCYTCKQRSLCKQVLRKAKKLLVVLTTSTLVTEKKKEELERVPCIWYPVTFKNQTEALLDSKSEVNAISQAFAYQLGLTFWKTNVGVQKIDGITLETYGMVVFIFFVSDKDGKERFFEESFLLANVKLEIVLEMPFLTMSNADVDFQALNL